MSTGMALALAGERIIKEKTLAHRKAIADRGYGTHYGDHSSYTPPAGASLTESSCVVWAMECAGAAFRAVGKGAIWDTINRNTRAQRLKGTVLVQQLIQHAGWSGVYWNPDTAKPADGSSEHPYSYKVAKSRKTYYNIRVIDYVIDYHPSPGSKTVKNLTGLNKLKKVPFWVGCARGGSHVFCGTREYVSEFHWSSPATDPKAMEKVALETYSWLSGIICIPTGVWQAVGR